MAIAGFGGSVKVGLNVVAKLSSWELEIETEELEDNEFGVGWTQIIAGLKSWSGSLEGSWTLTDVGQKALQDAVLGGTSVSLTLDVNGTNNYSGTAFITSQGVSTPVDDKVEVTFDFTGSGALTFV